MVHCSQLFLDSSRKCGLDRSGATETDLLGLHMEEDDPFNYSASYPRMSGIEQFFRHAGGHDVVTEYDGGFSRRTVKLSNGVDIPLLGIGTTHSGGYNHESLVYSIRDCGYRMIDTAKRYGLEGQIGMAITDSNVDRKDLFLISKLWPVDYGIKSAEFAFKESCRNLETDYLDLYMMHSPQVPDWFEKGPRAVREEAWRALELLYEKDLCKAIGVSNYSIQDIDELMEYCSVVPHVNQFECHPYYNPIEHLHHCKQYGILFTGYCPLGKGKILDQEPIIEVARRCNRTPAQVCIRWSIQNGIPAIPKSTKPSRVLENSQVFDFQISEADMQLLSSLHDENFKCVPLESWQDKFRLPCGYKLPKGTISPEKRTKIDCPRNPAKSDSSSQISSSLPKSGSPSGSDFFL